ncbi:MAG: hypothetical protein ABL986_24430 [Vicinamibacterales bacterium]
MTGYGVGAADGDLGVLKDFFFDDESWMIRFIVVETGGGAGRRVLLAPTLDCCSPDWTLQLLHVGMTIEDVMHSPDVDTAEPVSRQQELLVNAYYESKGATAKSFVGRRKLPSSGGDPHLRSFAEIRSYSITAEDGPGGHVYDVIVDSDDWEACYVVVGRPQSPMAKALVSVDWIKGVSWADRTLRVDLSVSALNTCPDYDPSAAINREDEDRLYDYHGRPKPWDLDRVSRLESRKGSCL